MERRTCKTPWMLAACFMLGAPVFAATPIEQTPVEPGTQPAGAPVRLASLSVGTVSARVGDAWQVETAVAAMPAAQSGSPRLSSYAARLTYHATSWRLSASHEKTLAWAASAPWPGSAMSAMYMQPLAGVAISATATWGHSANDGEVIDSYLLEGRYTRRSRHQFFASAANVTRSGEAFTDDLSTHMHPITAGTLGYVYTRQQGPYEVGVGFSITAFKVPPALESVYGERPLAYQMYLRVWPTPTR